MNQSGVYRAGWIALCPPGMGMNLWSKSPLYMNSVNVNIFSILTKVLAESNGIYEREINASSLIS